MQEQTPIRNKRKRPQKKGPKNVKLSGNNPWQNVQPQSNNQPFNFPGAIM